MKTASELIASADIDRREAELLLATLIASDRAQLKANLNQKISDKKAQRFKQWIQRRKNREPIAYILKSQPFDGQAFYVNQNTLIPRPETEQLVQWIAKEIPLTKQKVDLIWDVGTGSGAIAIALAKRFAQCEIIGSDISKNALTVAQKNAKQLNTPNITWIQNDLLGSRVIKKIRNIKPKRIIIVANLPYLPMSDKKNVMKDVVAYEPHQALFAPDNGMEYLKKLIRQLRDEPATKDGTLYAEYDPPQTDALKKWIQTERPTHAIKIKKDTCGKNRFLKITPKYPRQPLVISR